ncbi:transglutaminaseTgpA domain-containing protein [Halorubrum sp. PV6]|uniref:transglutaminase TgpA family protein n=1 Tax=Halorubrum sp. PV6 TaxID=634157 RepID=UPI000F852B74|nr:transglutaminase domain-containing protein [Halorubrum sp. PV6]AZQ14810.1 hypothetical protein DOS48_08205 [Halorubrum sp. PV6]
MSSRVVSVLVAVLCLTSVVVAAPLLQPDIGSPTESSVADGTRSDGLFQSALDAARASGSAVDDTKQQAEGPNPFADTAKYDSEAVERLASDENPFTPGGRNETVQGNSNIEGENGANGTSPGDTTGTSSTEGENSTDGTSPGGGEGTAAGDDTGVLRYGAVKTPYWRANAYDTYTGTGWERSTEPTRYNPPYEYAGDATRERYRVTAVESMSIVPSFYQPVAVSGLDSVVRHDEGSFERTSRMDAGTQFTVTSDVPEWTYAELSGAGDDYDEDLVTRYGTARAETPDRVHGLTDEITAGQSTPYGKAVAIEHWLKNERAYTLTPPEPGENVVDEFLFNLEGGYCEYFATAMTEMLRTQGIPARYVTGYARGQVDGNVEEVTFDRAHAWVEVYIEGVGWVTFDPTPPEREDVRSNNTEYTASVEDVKRAVHHAEKDDDWNPVDAEAELLSDPTPGTDGTVRVTQSGAPLVDHRVSYNGDVVGLTDRNGEVTGTLPYTANLEVTVEEYVAPGEPDEENVTDETEEQEDSEGSEEQEDSEGSEEQEDSEGSEEQGDSEGSEGQEGSEGSDREETTDDRSAGDGTSSGESGGLGSGDGSGGVVGTLDATGTSTIGGPISRIPTDTVFTVEFSDSASETASVESPARVLTPRAAAGSGGVAYQATEGAIPLTTDIDVTFSETPLYPGADTTVTASIDGVPVKNATVTADGFETRTNETGVASITVPYSEEVTVVAERGEASGKSTAPIATDVTLSAPASPPAGARVAVEAHIDDRPIDGLELLVDDIALAETNETGTALVPVGYDDTVDIVAERGAVRGSQTLEVNTTLDVTATGLPIPGTTVQLMATTAGGPVADATVRAAGTNTTTDENGTATVGIPLTPTREVGYLVRRGDTTAAGTVGLIRSWATIIVAGLLGGVAVTRLTNPVAAGRRGVAGGRRLLARLVNIPRLALSAIIRAAAWCRTQAARGGRGVVSTLYAVLTAVVAGSQRVLTDLPRKTVAFTVTIGEWSQRGVTRVIETVVWLAVGPQTWLYRLRGRDAEETAPPSQAGLSESDADDGEDATIDPRVVIFRAWNWLVGVVRPRQTLTPAEIAERAIGLGLPEHHVQRVLTGFRSLRYGGREPSQEDAETIADAERSLRSERGGEE